MNTYKKIPLVLFLAFPALVISHQETDLELLAMGNEFDNWAPAFAYDIKQTVLAYQEQQPKKGIIEIEGPCKVEPSKQEDQRINEIRQEYVNTRNDFSEQSRKTELHGGAAAYSGAITALVAAVTNIARKGTEPFYESPYVMLPLVVGGIITGYFTKQWWNHSSEKEAAHAALGELQNEFDKLHKAKTEAEHQHK